MSKQTILHIGLSVLAFVLVAGGIYLLLGFATLIVFGQLFEGSGHPPLPNAPDWLWTGTFLVGWPIVSLACGILTSRWSFRWLGSRSSDREHL